MESVIKKFHICEWESSGDSLYDVIHGIVGYLTWRFDNHCGRVKTLRFCTTWKLRRHWEAIYGQLIMLCTSLNSI